ncbi:DUF317 domain-containing protein [Streptomyces griseoviridis]|uniref:DUF317 domain-containing protein n=1 Tax=Streptomyces griseoviridis TaxID=45398 RepID=A0A3S9ZHL2_STRGD|nr:DUF317 domain-containing protein [Streptomyces griseoviridis]AZS87188.1 DUF317 domain-containing protein [Streptomyces griseoviridis]QCN85959.1 hypothetical protein DDJ31_14000 [Streptomyces griseoviridis]
MKKKQWQGWGPGEPAEQYYLVQPRALAGGGDVRHISEFLRASGWRDKSKTGGPLLMESPDRFVRVAYDPYVLPGGWTIHGRADGANAEWSAHLGWQTPVEIVAGLTDALTRPRSAHAPNVWAPLREQNWPTRFVGRDCMAASPDGTAWMQYHQDVDGSAMWWSGAQDKQGNGWTANFTPSTPMHLVQAFSAELARPDPVMRPRGRVPHSAQIRTWSVSVKPSQLNAWQQNRITTARADAWARNSARSGRPGTTARPYTPVGDARPRR